MNGTTLLACIPRRGSVRACPNGCIHATYSGVTLDFTSEGFTDFAQLLQRQCLTPEVGQVEIEYYHVTLRFSAEEFAEFSALLAEGCRNLPLWQTLQRCQCARKTASVKPFEIEVAAVGWN